MCYQTNYLKRLGQREGRRKGSGSHVEPALRKLPDKDGVDGKPL
jgi:hypothetical protein